MMSEKEKCKKNAIQNFKELTRKHDSLAFMQEIKS